MAQEYGALLKWPKEKEDALLQCKGKPSVLILKIELRNGSVSIHEIKLSKGWGYDECYEKCFEHIRPVKPEYLQGTIVSLTEQVEGT